VRKAAAWHNACNPNAPSRLFVLPRLMGAGVCCALFTLPRVRLFVPHGNGLVQVEIQRRDA